MSTENLESPPVDRKARALLFLARRLKELEARTHAKPAEAMAEAGMPYDRRRAELDQAAEANAALQSEIDAYRDAIEIVNGAA